MDSQLCIGLDPDPARLPGSLKSSADPVFEFAKAIVDATAEFACCYKPQFAHFAAQRAEGALERVIDYLQERDIPVLLDAKRGDVGSTAEQYAAELFDRYGADAVTINPYLGLDAMAPFLNRVDKGVFVLCRTSNPGAAALQNLPLASGEKFYEHVARLAAEEWNGNGNVGLVVGATAPSELAEIRRITGSMPFLVPGVGSQGGSVPDTMAAGQGGLMLISASRSIIYAGEKDFAEAAAAAAKTTRDDINAATAASISH